jgi:hypothetical protein
MKQEFGVIWQGICREVRDVYDIKATAGYTISLSTGKIQSEQKILKKGFHSKSKGLVFHGETYE